MDTVYSNAEPSPFPELRWRLLAVTVMNDLNSLSTAHWFSNSQC